MKGWFQNYGKSSRWIYPSHKKSKTANVIEATIKLISKRPIEDITIGEIAKKARVSQVTIYNHFENKNAVMIEAIKKLITDNVDQIHQILMSQLPFKERLYAYFDGVFLQSIERPRLDNIKKLHPRWSCSRAP